MKKAVCLILAGGSGTRFWPLSTPNYPKQFLTLDGNRSLLQQTYDRVKLFAEYVYVITNKKHVNETYKQLPELRDEESALLARFIPIEFVIGEPEGKDTAAAVAMGCWQIYKNHGDVPLVIVPADHLIKNNEVFNKDIQKAIDVAETKQPICFGVEPKTPETGYGYIKATHGVKYFPVQAFVEKPKIDDAKEMIATGDYYWNVGIYVWTTKFLWDCLTRYLPVHAEAISKKEIDGYKDLEKISIDYAMIQRLPKMWMIPAQFDWIDVGGWSAVESLSKKFPGNNRGKYDFSHTESKNNFVFCEDENEKLLLVGVEDLVVVRSGNRTLIMKKEKLDTFKETIELYMNSPHSTLKD